jgi:hypothetical protein
MSENQDLLSQLEQMLKLKRGKKFYADKLGISVDEVNELLVELRGKDESPKVLFDNMKKVNNEKGTIESVITLDFEPKNDIELAKLHKIDLTKYIITNYWSKLLPNGKFTSSVFSKLKQPKDYTPEDFANFLKGYAPKDNTKPVLFDEAKPSVDIEMSLSDFHLAKRITNGNNDIEVRKATFMKVLTDLLKKVLTNYNIDTVVFPISNDFFHTDNYQNQTTNGTPQDVIVDYAEEYEHGFDLLVQAISLLYTYCENVEVKLVQGNHDKTKSFYLAHALQVYFKNTVGINFDRRDSQLKAALLGDTFIGYHHGNCKIEDLPLLFATHPEYSTAFGSAKYREVHTGDKHHYMAKEIKGVRIQQMPSLSGSDRWHRDNNFVHSVRAALVLIYDQHHGKIGEFESRI